MSSETFEWPIEKVCPLHCSCPSFVRFADTQFSLLTIKVFPRSSRESRFQRGQGRRSGSWEGESRRVFLSVQLSTRSTSRADVFPRSYFRTGAGKSSLLQALFRIVELSSGSIIIDGYDISTVGLEPLRKKLAVIPQEALLYAGTVRENLDPVGEKDDASLNDSLRRAGLVAPLDASPEVQERFSKFKLDAAVSDNGANFSGGERQLVALCRALVKNSRVIVLVRLRRFLPSSRTRRVAVADLISLPLIYVTGRGY